MVLGFGSKKKKPVEEPVVRPSPSLPQLKEQRIPWPENLVDLNQVYATDYPSPPIDRPSTGSAKVSFQSIRGPIPFHRPFRDSTDQAAPKSGNPVSALFGTGVPPPPSSFSAVGARGRTATHPRTITRRAKYAPNFNVMVCQKQIASRAFDHKELKRIHNPVIISYYSRSLGLKRPAKPHSFVFC